MSILVFFAHLTFARRSGFSAKRSWFPGMSRIADPAYFSHHGANTSFIHAT